MTQFQLISSAPRDTPESDMDHTLALSFPVGAVISHNFEGMISDMSTCAAVLDTESPVGILVDGCSTARACELPWVLPRSRSPSRNACEAGHSLGLRLHSASRFGA